ncbi:MULTISPECIES: DegT/DnrJ/EryC1/StrS family aminotransferase [unclassified Bradyrhizobium]|uniref:DegT/DnrJ/EryC1/StrS family aminotransferase n=1 Tax=unclassified Bradyrhizobium TaxID=2631580 RepID=UPI002FF276BE
MIPVLFPFAQYRTHKDAIQTAIAKVLDGGTYILGQEVAAFERAFADFCGVGHAVGVGSGTDALILALKALDVGRGDEVITVSHTAVATVAAVLAVGATPVLVDVDPTFYTLDPSALDAAVSERTKAAIAVHLYGQTADLDAIHLFAKRNRIWVVEDCAQAAGGFYRGRRVGTYGDIGCFSFYPTKNLGGIGDGGMVVAADPAIADRVRQLRQYGWDDRRQTRKPGVNSRLDEIQAAILGVKLPFLDSDNARRRAIAARYGAGLAGLPLTTPAQRPGCEHVYHLYVIACADREALRSSLVKSGIDSSVHYPLPVHRQAGYMEAAVFPRDGLPVTERLVDRILTLPLYPEIKDSDVEIIIHAIRSHFGS